MASLHLKKLHWLSVILKNENLKSAYNVAKKEYNNLLQTTKQKFNENVLNNATNKNKTVWRLVNEETGRVKRLSRKLFWGSTVIS